VSSEGKKERVRASGNETEPEVKKGTPEPDAKQTGAVEKAGSGLDAGDAERTLAWLIQTYAKVRATQPSNKQALDKAWDNFTQDVKAVANQKVSWTVPLYTVTPDGIVTDWVKSKEDVACRGLRIIPDHQPSGFVSLTLKVPDAQASGQFRSVGRVLVSGVVEKIEVSPGKARAQAQPYEFHVRLSNYSVSPVK
jgi:hypothetical protein